MLCNLPYSLDLADAAAVAGVVASPGVGQVTQARGMRGTADAGDESAKADLSKGHRECCCSGYQ